MVTSDGVGAASDEDGSGVEGMDIGSGDEDGTTSTTVTAADGGPVPTCV